MLRRALCSVVDYRLTVGAYHTLCVDNTNEETSSLKRLFSDHGAEIKILLDSFNTSSPLEPQLEKLIADNLKTIPQTDWRYCIIEYPELFGYMSTQYLRMRTSDSNDELLIPNTSSRGTNYSVHLMALHLLLRNCGIASEYIIEEWGTNGKRYLSVGNMKVTFANQKYIIDTYTTSTQDIIDEAAEYIKHRV